MKLIIAVIQPEELPDIKEELLKRKIYNFTISNVLGQGMEFPSHEVYRGIAHEIKLLKKVRLEIKNGLQKDKILNEEDKILLYKFYLKLRNEFDEIEEN